MSLRIDLRTRKIAITGAAGGVGSALAMLLAEAGASLFLTDRPGSGIEKLANDLASGDLASADSASSTAAGAIIAGAEFDLASADIGKELVGAACDALGGLDGVVNAGAVLRRSPFLDVTVEQLEESLSVNLRSMFLICQEAARVMLPAKTGAFVNFTSPSAFTGGKVGATHYASAKAGVIALTRGLATEFGGSGLRANVLCPGSTDTQMIRGSLTDDQVAFHVAAVPMGRLAQPREIASATAFLLSDLASFVNGAVLTVDGGGSLRP